MKKNKLLIAIAIATCSSVVIADEQIDYSLSIKTWSNAINVANSSSNVTTQSINAPLITLVARKGDYFVNVSALLESSYRYKTVWLARKDYDVGVGYRLTDNFSLLAGHKSLVSKDGSQTNWTETNNGYYVGASGFKLVADQTYAYGNVQYAPSVKTSTTGTDFYRSQKFTSSEIGLGYVLNKNTQLTGGYRYQLFQSYNITQARSERLTVRGLLAGININF